MLKKNRSNRRISSKKHMLYLITCLSDKPVYWLKLSMMYQSSSLPMEKTCRTSWMSVSNSFHSYG